eukprot:scaffold10193_cov107-Isochrysis_galbana.AAC.6
MQVGPATLDECAPDRRRRKIGAAGRLDFRRDGLADLRHIIASEEIGHLARVEQIVEVLDKGLLLDLHVAQQEDSLLALLSRYSIWYNVKLAMDAASVVSDCRPDPPTPTRSALP